MISSKSDRNLKKLIKIYKNILNLAKSVIYHLLFCLIIFCVIVAKILLCLIISGILVLQNPISLLLLGFLLLCGVFLYLTIAFSFVLYFLKKDENKGLGYLYFLVQMILNLIWTPVFFGTKNILLALIVIILMDVFIILTIKKFYEVRKFAGLILIPYLIWTLFATYLNFGYFILN